MHLPRADRHRRRLYLGLTAFWSRSRRPAGTPHGAWNGMKTWNDMCLGSQILFLQSLSSRSSTFTPQEHPRDCQWQLNSWSMAWPSVLHFTVESELILTWKQRFLMQEEMLAFWGLHHIFHIQQKGWILLIAFDLKNIHPASPNCSPELSLMH